MSEVFFMVADNSAVVWRLIRRNHGEIVIKYGDSVIARDIRSEEQAFIELDKLMDKYSPPPKRIGH